MRKINPNLEKHEVVIHDLPTDKAEDNPFKKVEDNLRKRRRFALIEGKDIGGEQ